MAKVAIMTDSNSGITQAEAKELGIEVLPMPFYINDELFFEDITLTQEQFYEHLEGKADIKTSQPAPGDVIDAWDRVLKEYDQIVHIPMSSGLSSSLATAELLAQDYDGKVEVVDNKRISVTQRRSVLEAIRMADEGKTAKEIKDALVAATFDSDIYITLDTLEYLKRGGRLTPAAAAIGSVLNLKPVLRIKGEKLDSFAKTRGLKAAKKTMLQTVEKVLNEGFGGKKGPEGLYLDVAYSGSKEEAMEWKKELEEKFPEYEIYMAPLSLSVACHIGPGAKALAVTAKMD